MSQVGQNVPLLTIKGQVEFRACLVKDKENQLKKERGFIQLSRKHGEVLFFKTVELST
jgi:hypothetical protein